MIVFKKSMSSVSKETSKPFGGRCAQAEVSRCDNRRWIGFHPGIVRYQRQSLDDGLRHKQHVKEVHSLSPL